MKEQLTLRPNLEAHARTMRIKNARRRLRESEETARRLEASRYRDRAARTQAMRQFRRQLEADYLTIKTKGQL